MKGRRADFLTGVREGGGGRGRGFQPFYDERNTERAGRHIVSFRTILGATILVSRGPFQRLEWKSSALSEDGQIYICFCLLCVNLPSFNYPLSNIPAVKFDPISISCESLFKGTVS